MIKHTNKLLAGLLASALFAGVCSCTGMFDEYNKDPYQLSDEQMDGDFLRYGAMLMQMQRDLIPTSDPTANDFQRAQNLAGDVFSGYMAAIGTWGSGNNGTTYNMAYANWYDIGFGVAYDNIMSPWKSFEDYAVAGGDDAPMALANIMKVGGMHRIADMYGPLPYSRFGEEAVGNTPYDSQKDVYLKFFEELDWAIGVLEAFPEPSILAKYDMFFGGDVALWLKYANSLKLRLAVRLAYVPDGEFSGKKPSDYAAEAIAAGVLTANSDNVALKSYGTVNVYNPLYVCANTYKDIRMGASMESYLKGYEDPRLAAYFLPNTGTNEATAGQYWGVRNGLNMSTKTAYEPMSVPNIGEQTPVKIMSAAECYFLRAEAALRGWTAESAQTMYETGVAVSFEECKVPMPTDYLTDDVKTPANFTAQNGTTGGTSALGTITVKWDDAATEAVKLERIITQKWLAGFPEGQEAWSEFRRTGYPKIFPVVNNNSGGTVNTNTQVRRLIFPSTEYSRNAQGVAGGVQLLGGADNGGTKLWWDKK